MAFLMTGLGALWPSQIHKSCPVPTEWSLAGGGRKKQACVAAQGCPTGAELLPKYPNALKTLGGSVGAGGGSNAAEAEKSLQCYVGATVVAKQAEGMGQWKGRVMSDVVSIHPDAMRRRQEAAARLIEKEEETRETMAQLAGRSYIPAPENMYDVESVDELTRKLSNDGIEVMSVVCFKANWCKTCARMQYKVKKAAADNPSVQFLNVDLSDQEGELYRYCVKNGLKAIPYYLVYRNDKKVSEGKWTEIKALKW